MKILQKLVRLIRREATVDWGTLRAVEHFNTHCRPVEGLPAKPEDVRNGLVAIDLYYERIVREELARISEGSRRNVRTRVRV